MSSSPVPVKSARPCSAASARPLFRSLSSRCRLGESLHGSGRSRQCTTTTSLARWKSVDEARRHLQSQIPLDRNVTGRYQGWRRHGLPAFLHRAGRNSASGFSEEESSSMYPSFAEANQSAALREVSGATAAGSARGSWTRHGLDAEAGRCTAAMASSQAGSVLDSRS